MRTRWIRTIVTPVVAFSLAGCDSTEPTPDLADVILDFCADETPAFFAYQNEGGGWTRVLGDANSTFTFQATPRFAIAIVHQVGQSASSEFLYTTRTETEAFNNVGCTETAGSKSLSGTVTAMPTGTSAMISMANSFDYITSPTTSYSLTNLATGSLDLIAQRETFVTGTVPDKVIVRRAQNYASTIPVLDFSSSEAQNFVTGTLTVNGFSASEDNYLRENFSTLTTKDHSILEADYFTSATQPLYGIPNTQAGDLHETNVEGWATSGTSYRGETQYYRVPGNRTLTLGQPLNNPTTTTATPSPYTRYRVQLASQAEYNALMTAFFEQATSTSDRIVVVTVTAGYNGGTPTTWQAEIPDLSNVAGFPTSAMIQPGGQADWWIEAYGGSASGFMGKPADGTILHYAGRTSTVATTQQYRAQPARGASRASARTTLGRRTGLGSFR